VTVDDPDAGSDFDAIMRLPPAERVSGLARIGRAVANAKIAPAFRDSLVAALVSVIAEGAGTAQERVEAGEALGRLGDPRLKTHADADYWVRSQADDGPVLIGRFPVTNAEFAAFVAAGGYTNAGFWSDGGRAWLAGCTDPWPVRSKAEDARPYTVPNQPVVCVSWWEAEAFAKYAGGRLPRFDERLAVVRGPEKRPYPWGSPFGEGNANTREEVLGRPCAVGLYLNDRTPDGVSDLGGNVAEWTADGPEGERWYAPGAWNQPSMAAWAKAREVEHPEARDAGLGFRIVRDP
jgi:formylglycine-generating enzyme required for sulfatase activity